MEERIQKILARAGYGSRRAAEELITAGRVRVNGRAVGLGDKADLSTDTITVDGARLQAAEPLTYVAVYKPRGVLSAVDSPDPRPTVRSLVDLPGRLYPVGRLDVDSEGLILLTNDGELANRLTHPRYGHEKEYRVLVARHPDQEQLETWRRGVVLEDGYRTAPAQVRLEATYGKGAWLRVILREGRKRQIRETGARLGLPVVKIIRVRIGSLVLGALQPRQWRLLTAAEVAELKKPVSPTGQKKPKAIRGAPPGKKAPLVSARPATRPAAGRAPGRSKAGGSSPPQAQTRRPPTSRQGQTGGAGGRPARPAPRKPRPAGAPRSAGKPPSPKPPARKKTPRR